MTTPERLPADKRPRIALDMDEVMADVVPKFLDFYETQFGYRPQRKEWWGRKLYQLPNAEHLRNQLYEPGFFADLPVMPQSQEVTQWLCRHFDVFVVTAATEFRNSLQDKYDWLERHFPFIGWKRLVLCGDKSVISADYMIDDNVYNLEQFQGKKLLYTASHNVDETRFLRVNNWSDIRKFFEVEIAQAGLKPIPSVEV